MRSSFVDAREVGASVPLETEEFHQARPYDGGIRSEVVEQDRITPRAAEDREGSLELRAERTGILVLEVTGIEAESRYRTAARALSLQAPCSREIDDVLVERCDLLGVQRYGH